jgi:hypothetical protein
MPINVVDSIKKVDWKAFSKGPVFIVIVAALAFLGGRYTVAGKTTVVTVDKVVETHHEQTQVTQQVDIDKLLQKIQDKTRIVNRDVVKVVTIKPDGTRIETETDKSKIDATQRVATNSETKTSETSEIKKLLDDYRAEDHSKTVITEKSVNNYRVGILGGYSKGSSGLLTGIPGTVLGAFVDRKILGPLNAGVWANTQPGVGLQLSISF